MNLDLRNFTTSNNLYDILGISSEAAEVDIKSVYRKLVVVYHPDKHATTADKSTATEIFKRISVAYKTLASASERQRYDASLRAGPEFDVARAAREENISPLVQILAAIHKRNDIFMQDQIGTLDETLRKLVLDNLIHEDHFSETVVGAVPIAYLPTGLDAQRGSFDGGSMVYTTLRVIFAFKMRWEEQHGNRKTIHTDSYVQGLPIWGVERLTVNTSGRLNRTTTLVFERSEKGNVKVSPSSLDLTRLFGLLTLWGVPLRDLSVTDAFWDSFTEVACAPAAIVMLLVAAYGIVWICAGRDTVDGMTSFLNYGLFQAGVVTMLITAANGGARVIHEYFRTNVRELIEEMQR